MSVYDCGNKWAFSFWQNVDVADRTLSGKLFQSCEICKMSFIKYIFFNLTLIICMVSLWCVLCVCVCVCVCVLVVSAAAAAGSWAGETQAWVGCWGCRRSRWSFASSAVPCLFSGATATTTLLLLTDVEQWLNWRGHDQGVWAPLTSVLTPHRLAPSLTWKPIIVRVCTRMH